MIEKQHSAILIPHLKKSLTVFDVQITLFNTPARGGGTIVSFEQLWDRRFDLIEKQQYLDMDPGNFNKIQRSSILEVFA